jgi:hypothetical protein
MNLSDQLSIDPILHAFVEEELLPSTGIAPDKFCPARSP